MNKIFYNTEIYNSFQDYALGGFIVNEGEQVNYNLIYTAIYNKIEALISDYINRGMIANNYDASKYTKEDALVDIGFMIKDFLGFYPEILAEQSIENAILTSDQMEKWLNIEIKDRIKQYPFPQNATNMGIPNEEEMIVDAVLYKEAEEATNDMTLEQYLEQLSLIEL
jgi:hypothetical protein